MSSNYIRRIARALAQPTTYLGVAMLVAIYFTLTYLLITDRQTAEFDAGRRGDNLARVVDQSFSHIFKSVDATLQFLRKSYQQTPSAFDLTVLVHDPSIRNELTFAFMICDASGRVVDSSFSKEVIGTDRSHQEVFLAHANSAEDELIIGKPMIMKFNGKLMIPMSRRFSAPNGTFAGTITALLDPNELVKEVGTIDLGPEGSIALVGLDSYLRTRSVNGVFDWENIGRQVRLIPETLGRAFQVSVGHYWSVPGVFNNVRRLVSYRVLESFPLISLVTIPEIEVYRRANENARIYWGITLALTVGIAIAIGFGARREHDLIEATVALERSQERYTLVEAAIDDGIWDWNVLTDEAYLSPRWKAILGYADDELPNLGSSFVDRIHPDDKAVVIEAHRAQLEEGKPYSLDFRLRCKNGDYCWVYSRGQAVRDATGRPIRMLGIISDISHRKQAEALIEESRGNLARAEAMARVGHFRRDLVSGAGIWSEGHYRILGKSPESFAPTPEAVLELIHPDDRPIFEQHRRDVVKGVKPLRTTLRWIKDDGQIIYAESWSAPVLASDGSVAGIFGTIQDVTDRKQTEALIAESRDNLLRAEEMALLGYFKIEIGSEINTWSAGVYRIFGKSPDSFKPTLSTVKELFHPDDRPLIEKYRHDVMAGLAPPPLTLRVVRDDGQITYAKASAKPLRDGNGNVIGMFGAVQDITERKLAEILIQESRNNLSRAETMALLGHYKYDYGSDEYTFSEGTYRIFGQSPESFTPTLSTVMELTHPDDRPAHERYRRDFMAGLEPPPIKVRAVRGDGQIIYVESWAMHLRASDGTVTGFFGTIQDVTARKQAEVALAQLNQELEARIAERTAELAQEMKRREEAQMTLAQAQKLEAIGQLTAGIAHDFNNLLAVIGGGLEFIKGAAARGLTAKPELIDAAIRGTRRGADLVSRLLAFSRQAPLKAESTAVDQLVLDTLRLLQRTLGEHIEIVTRLDATMAVVSVDRNQLTNALLNLALNARDSMPEGGQLTIATTCQPAQWAAVEGSSRWPTGEEVCITIGDTGTGMTEEVRNRAFEPFFTTKVDGLGSGLGLSMVQGFVEQSGGHIAIDSAEGHGTTVTIRLPRIAAASQPDATDTAIDAAADKAKEKTVLLVEDDPDVRIVTAAQLESLGYKVHVVATGMEAMDLIASPADIDITLTDIVLPGEIDGVSLVKEVMRARPGIGVLCMSGYDPTQTHRKWLEIQNIEFLQKPFSSIQLAQALDDALAK